jgi:hypothetical protein
MAGRIAQPQKPDYRYPTARVEAVANIGGGAVLLSSLVAPKATGGHRMLIVSSPLTRPEEQHKRWFIWGSRSGDVSFDPATGLYMAQPDILVSPDLEAHPERMDLSLAVHDPEQVSRLGEYVLADVEVFMYEQRPRRQPGSGAEA